NQAIYSVSRGGLNMALMDLAEENPDVQLHFDQPCVDVDLRSNQVILRDNSKGEEYTIQPEILFGADGAYSQVRQAMQKTERYNYSQSYLDYGYKELTIPPTADGGWALEKNALHIWPRGTYMMIALPNLDGSFTCTLFFPYEGERSFGAIENEADLKKFFNEDFPDAVPLMPDLVEDYFNNPVGALVTVKCFPWVMDGKVALIGDAAHAIVPFYGQGMNAGFEDCTILNELMEKHDGDWERFFEQYQE
ncbi:MAG: FAD-dependent monooxygenase, partial [Hymenobacteraceae bacterium]|nr:FAD-dependent monooxygenase [Hymenobacteraceae bacterium]